MIPTKEQVQLLWDNYHLPEKKRIHVQLVAQVALFFQQKLTETGVATIHVPLLLAGCLLHDIDKNIPPLGKERHPETGVRILTEEGLLEVANLIRYHSVQYIENPRTAPKSWEEKLLFLSDKMVKQEIITVDKRFELWLQEDDLPQDQKEMLQRVYPYVKALENEIFSKIGILPENVSQLLLRSEEEK